MHTINITLNPRDAGTRAAVELLDGDLDKVNALNGPGVIFAQVFPRMLDNGTALGIELHAIALHHETGQKIKKILKEAGQ